jgi:hypothetical protein
MAFCGEKITIMQLYSKDFLSKFVGKIYKMRYLGGSGSCFLYKGREAP